MPMLLQIKTPIFIYEFTRDDGTTVYKPMTPGNFKSFRKTKFFKRVISYKRNMKMTLRIEVTTNFIL